MKNMWTITGIKEKGKEALKRNYWGSVVASILLILLAGGTAARATGEVSTSTDEGVVSAVGTLSQNEAAILAAAIFGGLSIALVVSLLLKAFVFNPLKVGCYRFFKTNVESSDAKLGTIMEGFGDYGRVFLTLLLRDIYLMLWTCLFVIPGLVKSYSYRMVPYIIKDNPELSANEVITRSREMMDGNKWRAFLFDLSFIGWILLGCVTFGLVNVFWTNPYMDNANAALYLELKNGNKI